MDGGGVRPPLLDLEIEAEEEVEETKVLSRACLNLLVVRAMDTEGGIIFISRTAYMYFRVSTAPQPSWAISRRWVRPKVM